MSLSAQSVTNKLPLASGLLLIILCVAIKPSHPSVEATVEGKQCSYTVVVHEVSDETKCPAVFRQRSRRHKTYSRPRVSKSEMPKLVADEARSQADIRDLVNKMHTVEVKLFDEIVKNRELNTTLTRHEIYLQKAENLMLEYKKNFTNLFRTLMFMEQKLQRQREINRDLDHKLSNVMIDVAEVNYVLEKKVPNENSNLDSKEVEVQAVSQVRSCGVTDDKARFQDCKAIYDRGHTNSGVYYITPTYASCPIPVWCDMDTPPGGWLVVQKRYDGSVNFNRGWKDYKNGFGNVVSEYWLGNDNLFLLTNQDKYELRFDLWDFEGNRVYAKYNNFKIDGERDQYAVHVSSYEGSAADSFQKHDGMLFSTSDHDNDEWKGYHCAREWEGGWWYKNCWFAILNGPYYNKSDVRYRGISWNDWKHEQLRRVEMKIRPSSGESTSIKPTKPSIAGGTSAKP